MSKAKGIPVRIGTSGWSYPHWRGAFYPRDLPASRWFQYYLERFDAVEINYSFYQLPSEKTFEHWRDEAPKDFVFAVKASRFITHMKKLKDPGKTLRPFMERVVLLRKKLGPILFQLPPRWRLDIGRLQYFLEGLDRRYRYAIEFRDPSWFDDRVYEALASHRVAFCIYDLDGRQSPREVTTDLAYVRLHGPEGPYRGRYDDRALSDWARTIRAWAGQGKSVHCYFDNDEKAFAAQNAQRLKGMLGC